MSDTVNHYAPLLAVLARRQCLLASNVFLVFPLCCEHATLYNTNKTLTRLLFAVVSTHLCV